MGGHRLAFYVEDICTAVAYLKSHGITVQGDPTTMERAVEGPDLVYFLSPWGMQLELVSYPAGIAVPHDDPVAPWSRGPLRRRRRGGCLLLARQRMPGGGRRWTVHLASTEVRRSLLFSGGQSEDT